MGSERARATGLKVGEKGLYYYNGNVHILAGHGRACTIVGFHGKDHLEVMWENKSRSIIQDKEFISNKDMFPDYDGL